MKIWKFIKSTKKNIGAIFLGGIGSVFGTVLYDLMNKIPTFSTLLRLLDFTVAINPLLLLLLVAGCLYFMVLFLMKNNKMKYYRKKYEDYRQEFFPKGANSPLVRIEVKNSIESYKYEAFVNDLYKYIPAYKIIREDNVVVAWITKEYNYGRIDEKLRHVQDINPYVQLDWLVVGV